MDCACLSANFEQVLGGQSSLAYYGCCSVQDIKKNITLLVVAK